MKVDTAAIASHLKQHRYPYIIGAVILAFNLSVLRALIADWIRDDNYSHGFFIIPISIFLFWRRRSELTFPAKPSGWGLALFIAGCFGLLFGIAASEYFTTRVGLVMIVTGVALHHLGTANFRAVWFPFFFLLFMIPIPAIIYYSATLPMQLFASGITENFLSLLGVQSYRLGNIIHLPDYALEVTEACSGLRSLMTLMALGALYGYMFLPGKVVPTLLFVATVPIAVATNMFRLIFTALAAYAISPKIAEDFLHELSGLMVFVIALILMVITGAILTWARKRLS